MTGMATPERPRSLRPVPAAVTPLAASDGVPPSGQATLTQPEAARLLGVSVRTVARRLDAGKLPSVVVDGVRRVLASAVMPDPASVAGSGTPASRQVSADVMPASGMTGPAADELAGMLAAALARVDVAEQRVGQLERAAVLVLDGRYFARRRARGELRGLLASES